MTDSNATELHELCELLNAQGIEWKKGDAAYQVEWMNQNGQHCSAMWWKPTLTVLMSRCTPEQAVAATLGSEPDETELTQIYDAGFSNGVMAVFQQLEGVEDYEELQDLIAEYWAEGEGYDEP